ncbi:carbamoyltransferase HypF, partial [Candidatus Bipolaricaulota bacterium]|nr:carbamoyltransferase HypF [Candidatus Bipolaricaulota bacterium]
MDNLTLVRVRIQGVVQGVGFRPFVYRLASRYGLTGWVRNTAGSVEIEAEGDEMTLRSFLASIESERPPRARIDCVEASFHLPMGHSGFDILPSRHEVGTSQLISPDIAICEDCRSEILDPIDRRSRYPFTNCTNCGPRFTIIEDIPYDRSRTAMHPFRMCEACQREYDDPVNRRFHAQPNACAQCGPRLWITDSQGVTQDVKDVLSAAVELLVEGKILAIKGLGGFHLVCDATNEDAVSHLRERKRRPSKPFAVMLQDTQAAAEHCILTPAEERLLESPECPIVLLRWRLGTSSISSGVAPNQNRLGVMLPCTPLHVLLLADADRPLVMTSGNLCGEPLAKENDEAVR